MKSSKIISNQTGKILLFGFLSWLIPFGISIFFFKPGGEMIIPYSNFKSIMSVTGTLTGCYLLYLFFMKADDNYIKAGIITGVSWFAINIILDLLILVPMMKTSFVEYFMSIGISYFSIPVISIAMAILLMQKTNGI